MLTKLRDSLAITWSRETLGHSQALPSLFLPVQHRACRPRILDD
jgi:hypothetical protein